MNHNVIVVGSGISGLTSALLLAKLGRKVTLLEQFPRPGGALKRFTRNGIPFDVGFHYTGCLGSGEILRSLWMYLGIWPKIRVQVFPETGYDALQVIGYPNIIKGFFSFTHYAQELKEHFPEESRGIDHYFATIQSISRSFPFFDLDQPLESFSGFHPAASKPVAPFIRQLTSNPRLQAVLAVPGFLYGVPAQSASLLVHAIVAHVYLNRVYAIDKGGQGVVDAFLARFKELDVTLRTDCKVEKMVLAGGKISGVSTNQGDFCAEEVIFTGHPTRLLNLVPENALRPAFRHHLQNLRNTLSMFMLFGSVDEPAKIQALTWTNHYLIPPGPDIFPEREELALMMTAPGLRDRSGNGFSKAAQGVVLMSPTRWEEMSQFLPSSDTLRSSAYQQWKETKTQDVLQRTQAVWGGQIGWINPVVAGSPLTIRDELDAPEGGIYGIRHDISQFAPSAKTRIPGLWLSGQSTLMTGVVGASLSALVTVGKMNDLAALWKGVGQCR